MAATLTRHAGDPFAMAHIIDPHIIEGSGEGQQHFMQRNRVDHDRLRIEERILQL